MTNNSIQDLVGELLICLFIQIFNYEVILYFIIERINMIFIFF